MKTIELKVGNIIMFSEDSTIFQVTGINEYGVDVKNDDEETYIELEQFEPIQLTQEWLLKLGFEKQESPTHARYSKSISKNEHELKLIMVSIEPGNIYVSIRQGGIENKRQDDDVIDLFNSDYHGKLNIHWLQNLYSTLTGTELYNLTNESI